MPISTWVFFALVTVGLIALYRDLSKRNRWSWKSFVAWVVGFLISMMVIAYLRDGQLSVG
ncbi:hypothetical protein [Pyruvatibacter sp.]|uniref:hypothetical protein n=1 Tax=Pyruvatibacter sp. TaxID=1981328 RepID=UPI0032660BC0